MVHTSPAYLLALPAAVTLSPAAQRALEEIEAQFDTPTELLAAITDKFQREMEQGLAEEPTEATRDTFMRMIPTFVQHVPSGTETGTFLALDLGGSNLRTCSVTLLGESRWTMKQQKYSVPSGVKEGEASKLFDYIAASLDSFLMQTQVQQSEERLNLGFTFSFPVDQTAIDSGKLINWTKGYSCTNAVGNDVVTMLQDALDRKHIHVKVVALVNDTAGTLMASAYEGGDCLCGGIFGTGTNGAYVEASDKITKMAHAYDQRQDQKEKGYESMVINTEWGAFDNERHVLRFTHFDNRVDRISINPRKQAFEKMISGMYLGEVTRNVILFLVDSQVIFGGRSSPQLNAHYGLDTAIMSALEKASDTTSSAAADPIASIKKVIIHDLGIDAALVSDADAVVVARVSEIVGSRGCRLSACAIAAVVRQTGFDHSKQPAKFGLDGSLVEYYPRFDQRVRQALTEVLGPELEKLVEISLAKDGSGIGAALCAHAAMKQREAGL